MTTGADNTRDPRFVSVREVGGASRASLSLQGTVLVHKATNWAGRTAIFIPIECLSVSRTSRYDRRYLVQGLRVLAAIALASLAVGLWLGWDGQGLGAAPRWYVAIAGAISGLTAAYFLYILGRYLRPNPAIRFEADLHDGRVAIECWNGPDDRKALDPLLKNIDALQKRVDELVPYPTRHSYELFHVHPFRLSVMHAVLFTLLLYVPVRIAAAASSQPWLYAFLLAPTVVYVGRYAIDHFRMLMQPLEFQEAVAAYDREDLHTARRKLDVLLAEWPDYLPGLLLFTQVCTLLKAYDAAFRTCDRVDGLIPELGAPLRDEILAIERIQRRMDDEV